MLICQVLAQLLQQIHLQVGQGTPTLYKDPML